MSEELKIITVKDRSPIVKSFNGLGLNIELDGNSAFRRPIYSIIIMFAVFMWGTAAFRHSAVYIKNVDLAVPGMIIVVQVVLTVSKYIILITRRKRILRLNNALERLASLGNQKEHELWNAKNRPALSISKIYFIVTQLTTGLCVVLPLIKLIYYYTFYGELVYTLPFPGIFPFDFELPRNFAFTTLLTALFACFFVFTLSAIDGLFSWFVYNISSHLQIMYPKLEHLLEQRIEDVNYQLEFVALITYHRHVITLASELNDVYAPIIFMVVTCSCLPLGFLVYQLSYLSDLANLIYIFLMLVAISLQLIIYCFGGETVQNACDELCKTIYLIIPWHSLPPKQRRLYLMPLIRSQRLLVLKGYFFTANRSLLVGIFQTVGSLLTMLLALRRKGE